jgi:hypothetical protein
MKDRHLFTGIAKIEAQGVRHRKELFVKIGKYTNTELAD